MPDSPTVPPRLLAPAILALIVPVAGTAQAEPRRWAMGEEVPIEQRPAPECAGDFVEYARVDRATYRPDGVVVTADGAHEAQAYRSADYGSKGVWPMYLVDGVAMPGFAAVGGLVFDASGTHTAYLGFETNGDLFLVVDGKARALDALPEQLAIASSPLRIALAQRVAGTEARPPVVVRLDGVAGPAFDDVGAPRFSADGQTLTYPARRGGDWHMVVGTTPGPAYEAARAAVLGGGRVAYAAKRAGQWRIVVDGVEGPGFAEVGDPVLSEDGRRIAYRARALAEGPWSLLIDGVEGPERYATLGEPVFSPDGKHVAATGQVDGTADGDARNWTLFIDRRPGPWFVEVGDVAVFSADSQRVGATVRRGLFDEDGYVLLVDVESGGARVIGGGSGPLDDAIAVDGTGSHVVAVGQGWTEQGSTSPILVVDGHALGGLRGSLSRPRFDAAGCLSVREHSWGDDAYLLRALRCGPLPAAAYAVAALPAGPPPDAAPITSLAITPYTQPSDRTPARLRTVLAALTAGSTQWHVAAPTLRRYLGPTAFVQDGAFFGYVADDASCIAYAVWADGKVFGSVEQTPYAPSDPGYGSCRRVAETEDVVWTTGPQ